MSYRRRHHRDHRSPWDPEPRVRHFGGGTIPTPPPPPEFPKFEFPPIEMPMIEFPAPFDAEAAEAKRKRAEEIKAIRLIEQRRKGYSSSLLTGGLGLENAPPPETRRPGLMGR